MNDKGPWMVAASVVVAGWLLWLLAPVLTPFAAGALLGYLGDPLVDRLQRLRLGRTLAVCVVFAGMLVILVLALLLLVPLIESQVTRLIQSLPAYLEWIENRLAPWVQARFGAGVEVLDIDQLTMMLREHWQQAGGIAATVLSSISRSGLAVLGWIMTLVLIPVVAFYFMRDWDHLLEALRELLPRRVEPKVVELARESNEVLGSFLRGQLMVMLALGIIYSAGLWLVGLDLAFLIGMVAGLISFVPYLGSIVGVLAACIAAAAQFAELVPIILVLVVFGIGQALEGMVLTPWLVGDRIGMHPVAVIFAVLAGGQLFGFVGVLLALPVAAVIMVLLRHAHDHYKGSHLYRKEVGGPAGEGP